MSHPLPSAEAESDPIDHAALRLMLSYVEAECLRIGAMDAARHAALAAALMPMGGARLAEREAAARQSPSAEPNRSRRVRNSALH